MAGACDCGQRSSAKDLSDRERLLWLPGNHVVPEALSCGLQGFQNFPEILRHALLSDEVRSKFCVLSARGRQTTLFNASF